MTRKLSLVGASAATLVSLGLAGCSKPTFTQPMQLGGQSVSASTLNKGKEQYTLYCRPCHADDGKGAGPAAAGLRPPPRDFTQALFKFGWVTEGLPHDEDLRRIVKSGLHGTAMLPWAVRDQELTPILQYVKTFAPEDWKDAEALGSPIEASNDPWGAARKTEAVERGKELYHGTAQCWTCHPAFATQQWMAEKRGNASFRPNLYFSEAKESKYRVGDKVLRILPPDFTWSPLRSTREGSELEDLFKLISAGIPGTAMPQWKGGLPDEDIWALSYYVRSLTEMRDTLAAAQLRDELQNQPPYVPPAPAEGQPAPATPPPGNGAGI